MAKRDVEDIYPLTPLQEGMFFHSLLSPTGGDYVSQLCFRVGAEVDLGLLERSWSLVINRHPALRSSVEWRGLERPLQLVHRHVTIPVEHRVWQEGDPAAARWRDVVLVQERHRGLDMASPPLMRLTFLTGPNGQRELVWTVHHLLLDGWARPLLLGELRTCYRALARGEAPSLPERRPYRDYIAWLTHRDASADEAWWRGALDGFETPTRLLGDGHAAEYAGGQAVNKETTLLLSTELTEHLRNVARESRVTLSTLVLGAWGVLLSRYSGSSDVVFGLTVSGRPAELVGVEMMIGLFINTVPVRVKAPPEKAIRTWLQQLQAEQVELRQHEHSPLVDVQAWSQLPPNTPLFETLLVYENYPDREGTQAEGEDLVLERSVGQTNLPLTLVVVPGEQLAIHFSYHGARFAPDAMRRLSGHLKRLLEGIAARPDSPLGELEMLTAEEIHRQVVEWNATEVLYPRDACVHELFEEQVRRDPDAVALSCDGEQVTYGELNRRANGVARRLRELGVVPDVVVGVHMERSLELVVGLLGVLKAGGAFLPLDPSYPIERLGFMISDAGVSVVVTQEQLRGRLAGQSVEEVVPEETRDGEDTPASGVRPENLAYVMYTSGSTGTPKGVMVEHRNVVRLFEATDAWFGFGQEDVWTLFHSFAFDFSVWEMWGALLHGGRLVVVPYMVSRSPELFHELLERERVTVLNQTPLAFRQLIEEDSRTERDLSLRVVVLGGEALDVRSLRGWVERHGDEKPELVNMYGITETTVHVTYQKVSAAEVDGGFNSIGKPIPDLLVYVLDARQKIVPPGIAGELYVGGAGVSRGYLGREELTRERFVANPFVEGGRLYRSGDLGRYGLNGQLEYLGRADDQVKIRGFRIEPGEVEAVLFSHPRVAAAAVVAREDAPGGRSLVAYVVPRDAMPTAAELRDVLRQRLPEYMVPAAFVALAHLPLTSSGKLDRALLPAPDRGGDSDHTYVAPRTNAEERIAAIWGRILRLDRVGIHDDFFDLGGHSLLVLRLLGAMEREFGVEIPLASFFRGDVTVADLAAVVENTAGRPASGGLMVGDQTRAASPVIFFVYPNESSILTLRHFTKPLADHRIVGLHHTHDGRRFDRSRGVEDLTLPMLEAIRRVQPSGPYRIAGYSFGGLLAYELASQLRACGDEVAWLGILDAAVPGVTRGPRQRRLPRLWHIARQRDHGPREALRLADDVIRREFRALLVRLHVRPMQTRDWDWRGARKLAQKYTCRPNDAPLDVFATEDTDPEKVTSLGWDTVHRGPLRVHHIPGNHKTMVQEPYASILAGELVRSLRTAPERAEAVTS